MSDFTGERLVPGGVDADLWNEHISRYAFAASLAAGRERVIDAGCGTGYGTRLLARRGTQVFGIDNSSDAIRFAVRNYATHGIGFLGGSVEALPFADDAADLIVAFEVIEHLAVWRDFLLEAHRVLAPDGILMVSTPNSRFYTESRGDAGPNPFHVHEFDLPEFNAALGDLFPHVQLFGQNHSELIAFSTPGEPASTAYVESLHTDLESAAFFVAVCGRAPLPHIPNYLYVPGTANVLRERALHIEKLTREVSDKSGELEAVHREHATLVNRFRVLENELLRSNEWAASLDQQLQTSGSRVQALQAEVAHANAWAGGLTRESADRALRIVDLQVELSASQKTAQETIERLEDELAARARWAGTLDAEIAGLRTEVERGKRLDAQLATYRASRWMRLGKTLHVGPLARE